jgi:uncharacterized protein Smg (DUF494 family)
VNYSFLEPIQVRLTCTRELVNEALIEVEDIEIDREGRDVLIFECPLCDGTHTSFRYQ